MTWWHQLLRPAARVAGYHAGAQLRQFARALPNAVRVQDDLLQRLVRHHAATRFGRDHNLAAVRTYDDFRQAVPLGDYETLRPYLQSVYEGDTEAMFPAGERILMFALTSGTTGQPKTIPVTAQSLASYRRGWNIFGLKSLTDHPAGWLRKILQISSPSVEHLSPTGLPCGAISGMLATTQKRIVRSMYVVPPEVMSLSDPQVKYYTMMRLAMPQDVALITTANPSTVVQFMAVAQKHLHGLLRDLHDGTLTPPGDLPSGLAEQLKPRLKKHRLLVRQVESAVGREGQLLCEHFWRLSNVMLWTGGTLGLYLPQVRKLAGNVPIRDIGLLASEGRFSIPLDSETSAGPADILGNFLEFIPADEIDSPSPAVLRCHELTIGQEYFMVLTNFSGLWRYNIHDRVRVTDYVGQTPVFAFLSKGAHTANLTGEKLTEHQVIEAMARASGDLGLAISRFLLQPHFSEPPYYRLTTENADSPALAATLDRILQELNIEYASKRHSGRLGPIQLTARPHDWFQQRERELIARRGRNEQYKHQYLLTDIVNELSREEGASV
jgi:hypothetical protein